jgi:hypothetical protein
VMDRHGDTRHEFDPTCPSSDALRQVEASAKGGSGSVAVLA